MIENGITPAAKVISCPHSQISSSTAIEEGDLAAVHFSDMLTYGDGTQLPASLMTQVGIEWNEHSLFVFFRGRFDELRYSANLPKDSLERKTPALEETADVYEVYIGPRASSTKIHKKFQVTPDGRWFDIDINTALGITNPHWHSGCMCKSFVDTEMKIWSGVFELPWQCFGASYDSEHIWNVNFCRTVISKEGKNVLPWSSCSKEPFNPAECFGKILFVYDP